VVCCFSSDEDAIFVLVVDVFCGLIWGIYSLSGLGCGSSVLVAAIKMEIERDEMDYFFWILEFGNIDLLLRERE
nr:hypothetical protein [Tanacetum cinerariifolium]